VFLVGVIVEVFDIDRQYVEFTTRFKLKRALISQGVKLQKISVTVMQYNNFNSFTSDKAVLPTLYTSLS